jgi:hypothetical protein
MRRYDKILSLTELCLVWDGGGKRAVRGLASTLERLAGRPSMSGQDDNTGSGE